MGALEDALHRHTEDLSMTTELPQLKTTEGTRLSTSVGQSGTALIIEILTTDLLVTVGLYCRLMTDLLATVGLYCRLLKTAPYFRLVAQEAAVQTCTGRSIGAGTHQK